MIESKCFWNPSDKLLDAHYSFGWFLFNKKTEQGKYVNVTHGRTTSREYQAGKTAYVLHRNQDKECYVELTQLESHYWALESKIKELENKIDYDAWDTAKIIGYCLLIIPGIIISFMYKSTEKQIDDEVHKLKLEQLMDLEKGKKLSSL